MIIKRKNILKNKNLLEKEFVKPGENTPEIFADIFYLQKHVGEIKTINDLNKVLKFIKQNVTKSVTNIYGIANITNNHLNAFFILSPTLNITPISLFFNKFLMFLYHNKT